MEDMANKPVETMDNVTRFLGLSDDTVSALKFYYHTTEYSWFNRIEIDGHAPACSTYNNSWQMYCHITASEKFLRAFLRGRLREL
jgi:hypothetical protein